MYYGSKEVKHIEMKIKLYISNIFLSYIGYDYIDTYLFNKHVTKGGSSVINFPIKEFYHDPSGFKFSNAFVYITLNAV